MKKLLVATQNPGKVLEYKELLKDLPIEVVTLQDLGVTQEAPEDAPTFEENALEKVNFYSQFADFPTIAEDSGLEIDYLNGEPGVKSRRWPGHRATDDELVKLIIEKMKGVPKEQRGAQFRVVMALKIPGKDPVTSEGILRGYITDKPIETVITGFPYRSMFFVPQLGKVLGEMTMNEEARIGHRKQALEKLLPLLL